MFCPDCGDVKQTLKDREKKMMYWHCCEDKKGKIYHECPACDALYPGEIIDYCARCGEELEHLVHCYCRKEGEIND